MNGYTKTAWIDNSTPAINAENLNHIEQGIKDVTDEVINGTLHIVDVPYTAENNADSCTDANTIYRVYVNSGVVTTGYLLLICSAPIGNTIAQYGFSKDGYIISRTFNGSTWSAWTFVPHYARMVTDFVQKTRKIAGIDLQDDITASELKTALGVVASVTLSASDNEIPTAKAVKNCVDDLATEVEGWAEDTTNKVITISSLSTDTEYPSALAVKNYVDAAIAAALNG